MFSWSKLQRWPLFCVAQKGEGKAREVVPSHAIAMCHLPENGKEVDKQHDHTAVTG